MQGKRHVTQLTLLRRFTVIFISQADGQMCFTAEAYDSERGFITRQILGHFEGLPSI